MINPDDAIDRSTPYTQRQLWAKNMPDSEVPWWAIGLLNFKEMEREHRVYARMRQGRRPKTLHVPTWWELWANCIEAARDKVMQRSIEDWRSLAANSPDSEMAQVIRDAALSDPRAFVTLCNLCDDDGNPIVLKDFHIKSINAMRRSTNPACLLLPFEHGKSYLGSIVVPLMDWAEWNDATEGRIYWSESHAKKWIRRLMGQVEHNEALHQLFPWVSKPVKGDPGFKVWSTKAFSIHGRTLSDAAFEVLTAQTYATGNRYHRVGCDDWVNEKNSTQVTVQDLLFEYLHSGALTFLQTSTRRSRYGTAWPGFYYCGTLFTPNDVGARIYGDFQSLGYRTIMFDVFVPNTKEQQVIWPEYRSLEHIEALKNRLGTRSFNMRCRNMLHGTKTQLFPEEVVRVAEHDGTHGDKPFEWRVVPERTRVIIGFDPGSGKITKDSKNPAFAVYGAKDVSSMYPGTQTPYNPNVLNPRQNPLEQEIEHHIIEWGRLDGYSFPRQIDKLIELALFYGCPIAVEDNNIQTAYGEEIKKQNSDIKVFGHHTGMNKRDARDGVDLFEPLFANHKIVIHAKDAPQEALLALHNELTQYPGRYTDIIMALWIARYQFQQRMNRERPVQIDQSNMPRALGNDFLTHFGSYLRRG